MIIGCGLTTTSFAQRNKNLHKKQQPNHTRTIGQVIKDVSNFYVQVEANVHKTTNPVASIRESDWIGRIQPFQMGINTSTGILFNLGSIYIGVGVKGSYRRFGFDMELPDTKEKLWRGNDAKYNIWGAGLSVSPGLRIGKSLLIQLPLEGGVNFYPTIYKSEQVQLSDIYVVYRVQSLIKSNYYWGVGLRVNYMFGATNNDKHSSIGLKIGYQNFLKPLTQTDLFYTSNMSAPFLHDKYFSSRNNYFISINFTYFFKEVEF